MTKQELLDRVKAITVSMRDHRPALYKPLLLLVLFSRVGARGVRRISFSEVEGHLRLLIRRYSPEDSAESVGQPWWHLPTDGLWRVVGQEGDILRESETSRGDLRVPSCEELRKQQGEFPPAIRELLSRDPGAALDAIDLLLAQYFGEQDPMQRTGFLNDVGYLEDGGLAGNSIRSRIGRPYVNAGRLSPVANREPFETDPDVVDRGNQAHASTLDALADFLRGKNIQPLRPEGDEPSFDLAWEHDGLAFVAEVKSLTEANEEKQLRLGLGQVLRYRQALETRGMKIVPVLVPERRPTEPGWSELCSALGVRLAWPGAFGSL